MPPHIKRGRSTIICCTGSPSCYRSIDYLEKSDRAITLEQPVPRYFLVNSLMEVQFPYNPACPSVGPLVGGPSKFRVSLPMLPIGALVQTIQTDKCTRNTCANKVRHKQRTNRLLTNIRIIRYTNNNEKPILPQIRNFATKSGFVPNSNSSSNLRHNLLLLFVVLCYRAPRTTTTTTTVTSRGNNNLFF